MDSFKENQRVSLENCLQWQYRNIERILNDEYTDLRTIPYLYTVIGKAEMVLDILRVDHDCENTQDYLQGLKTKAEQLIDKLTQEARNA